MNSILLTLLVILISPICGLAQSADIMLGEHFRILSFSINGESTTEFDVLFLVDDKSIKPERNGSAVIVPTDVRNATWMNSGIRFVSGEIDFRFDHLAFKGYIESDNVKSDYKVEVFTDLALVEERLREVPAKTKTNWGIKKASDVCFVFILSRIPSLSKGSVVIADPVSITRVELCEPKAKKVEIKDGEHLPESGDPRVSAKSHKNKTTLKECREWRRIEIAGVTLCVPKDLKPVHATCIHLSCRIFESEHFILKIDDDIAAQYPTFQTKYPSYSEEQFETNFGTALMWFYENEGEIKYVSAAQFLDKTNEMKVLTVSFVSKTLPVKEIAERIFRSVELKETPKRKQHE